MLIFKSVVFHVYVFVLIFSKQPVVRLIEEASCRGLKEVRFVTWHNQYILNIKDGFQQNACFRREIKRRPLLRSCIVLMPFLQYVSQQNGNFAFVLHVVLSVRIVFLKIWQGNRHHWVEKSEEKIKNLARIGSSRLSFFKINIV